MKNKSLKYILSVLILAVAVVVATSLSIVAYAVWVRNISPQESIPVPSEDFNASAKHILFVALDSSGSMISKSDTVTVVDSFGAIGYTGIIAELEIPADFSVNESAAQSVWGISAFTKNVTFVGAMDNADISNYHVFMDGEIYNHNDSAPFSNNQIVSELKIGVNVERIAEGAFSNMGQLNYLNIMGLGDIEIGDYAFMGCNKLTASNVFKSKYINGNLSLIFYGMTIPVAQ